jgi:hypothetical protein
MLKVLPQAPKGDVKSGVRKFLSILEKEAKETVVIHIPFRGLGRIVF